QRHEALGLGVDIVGFDVQVDARGVVDLLQQQDRLVAFGGQTRVLAVAVLVDGLHALAQRLAPELDVRGEVVDLAVQDETRQSAVVGHAIDSRSEGRGCVPGWIQPISGRPSSARSTLWSRLASLRGMARMMPGAARAISLPGLRVKVCEVTQDSIDSPASPGRASRNVGCPLMPSPFW